ncbi:MAG: 50S ribosomal protein L3 [Candidatus Diapherotrites archaeon]|nr:50S ribosomal protein L3 [Candidatus Diapherotrites archaeon]
MPEINQPRSGSLGFSPRKKAKRIYSTISTYPKSADAKPLAFMGYKAGMTHLHAVSEKAKSPKFGQEIQIPVTIIECPPMKVAGIRLYSQSKGRYGINALAETWAKNLNKELARKIILPKTADKKALKAKETDDKTKEADGKANQPEDADFGIKKMEQLLKDADELRLIVYTQPKQAKIKKTPELGEIGVGGSIEEAFNYAKDMLGKEINASDVFSEGEFLDVKAVTKGKGFQGPVKRWGITIQRPKATKKRRHIGSVGPWHPAKILWTVPMAGQMGFFNRTELNKKLIKIGEDGKEITPKGGLVKYGEVNSKYVLVAGSVPGPKKRLIALRKAIRHPKVDFLKIGEITNISTSSQQGV